uniref:C-C motif chemokine receptor 8 n=1 Tax=Cyclopterus lumpus TaxID=8103 RepID=A0A8C2XT06_CYCLU
MGHCIYHNKKETVPGRFVIGKSNQESIDLVVDTVSSTSFYFIVIFESRMRANLKDLKTKRCLVTRESNTTVLWVLLRYIKLKTMTDVCLLNLALSDLILAITLFMRNHNDVASPLCFPEQLGFYSGMLFVTLMSVDRYLAIVHAVAAMRARTLRYGVIASITIWVISVIMALPGVTFASLERNDDDNSSECHPLYPEDRQRFWKILRNFSENTVGLFVCLPIMIFCYVKILVVLSRSRNAKKDRAVKLIFIIVCVFVVCWVPYNVTVFLQTLQLVLDVLDTCKASKSIDSAVHFAEIIALFHCCVNPVIYAFVGEKFRKSLGNSFAHHKRQGVRSVSCFSCTLHNKLGCIADYLIWTSTSAPCDPE